VGAERAAALPLGAMFDFDEVEAGDPTPVDQEEEDPVEAARVAGESLGDREWRVRWDACRTLAKLGATAAPFLPGLYRLAEAEPDEDVRETARSTLTAVREAASEEFLDELALSGCEGLSDESFTVRRKACWSLAAAGFASGEYLPILEELAASEQDFEVKKAAKNAVRELRSLGVRPPPEPVREEASAGGVDRRPGQGRGNDDDLLYTGPRVLFQVFEEVLEMHLEEEGLTPSHFTEIWENEWGVPYASRLRMEAPEGHETSTGTKWLHRTEDVVPRSPFVTRLDAGGKGGVLMGGHGAGSILYSLATAFKEYGRLTREEVATLREEKRLQLEVAARYRSQADSRELARFRQGRARAAQAPRAAVLANKGGSSDTPTFVITADASSFG